VSDPTLKAIITLVREHCDASVREATGFSTASVLNIQRDAADAAFVKEMTKIAESIQDGGN
jgi:hypothetical protein